MANQHRSSGQHAEQYTPLVLLHGFTQTGGSWAPLLPYLPPGPKFLPDLPGHGGASPAPGDLWSTAARLSGLVDGPASWVGYSMGGRAALHVALAHPGSVARLALVSATAGIVDAAERAARRQRDEALARRVEAEGVEEFVRWWVSQDLFATLPADRARADQRLVNTAGGLASSLRRAGTGAQEPLWDRLAELGRRHVPVLLLAGELDTKYVSLASAMARAIGPTASVVIVEGAGHACHLERPDVVGPALSEFLTS